MLKVALIQQSCTDNKQDNINKTSNLIRQAANQKAELIVLQELHNTQYFCQEINHQHFKLAETIPGPSTEYFGALAKELNIVLVISLFEKRMAGVYHNTAVVIEKDGSIAGMYRKMHIPEDPQFHEKFYFTPGDLGFNPIQTSIGKLGVLICWDQWFPEAARIMALKGADVLIYPTAIGWIPTDPKDERESYSQSWQTIQRSHAIANGIPVLSVNRVGFEPLNNSKNEGIEFWGKSFIVNGYGEYISQASTCTDEIIIGDINLEQADQIRTTWPFLRDRQYKSYNSLVSIGDN